MAAFLSYLPAIISALGAGASFMGKRGGSNQGNDEFQKLPTMTGGQTGLLEQLMQALQGGGMGGGPLGAGMQSLSDILSDKPEAFAAFEKPFKTQFEQQTVPGLAERFSSIGSGSQGSSGFGQQLGAAGANLSENLASMRSGLKQNALTQLMGMMQTGLGAQQFGYGHRTPPKGFLESILPGLASGAGTAGTAWALKKWGG